MASDGTQSEPAALRLARYLKEYVGIRTTTIRDVGKYDKVIWFCNMPQESDCWSGAWSDEIDPDAPWLEVRKQTFDPVPSVPESVVPWADEHALKQATEEIPPLKSSILVPDPDFEGTGEESPPLLETWLVDHPEVQAAYERYRPKWEAWATEHRRREAIQKVYADLFQLHTRLRKEGELIEVVLGLGLMDWNPKVEQSKISVRRHAIVARTEIEFAPKEATIRLIAPAEGARLRIEDDMLEANLRPDGSDYATLRTQLDEVGDAVWDKSLMHSTLSAWANALTPHNHWQPGLAPPERQEGRLIMSLAPALIVRKRTQTGMVRIYESLIEQLSASRSEVPRGWTGLVEDIDDDISHETQELGPDGLTRSVEQPSDVYFPLPANREQQQIVEAIRKKRGVLVQGPPGTGKSHTIANLICHLLATGQRVLVTAETARALQVLQDKLPNEIKPLCVSLLGQGGDAFTELNRAVQGITTKQATYTPGAYDGRIAELKDDLHHARRELAKVDAELRSLRESEIKVHTVANGAYSGTASQIAARVANEREQFGWLKLPYESEPTPPCSNGEMRTWLEVSRRNSESQAEEVRLKMPASEDVPTPAELIHAISAEKEAADAMGSKESLKSHPAYGPLCARSSDKRRRLKDWLKKLDHDRTTLGDPGTVWLRNAVCALLSGRAGRWDTVAELSQNHLAEIESRLNSLGGRVVTIKNGHDPRRVRADAESALVFLSAGGAWKRLVFLTPKELKERTYLTQDVRVDGIGAMEPERLQAVCDHLTIQFAFEELRATWQSLAVNLSEGDWRLQIADLKEHLNDLEAARTYAKNCREVAASMASATPSVPAPNWLSGEIQEWIAVIDAVALEDRLQEAQDAIQHGMKTLREVRDLHDVHPVVPDLTESIESRDATGYSAAHARLLEMETTRAELAIRDEIASKLEGAVPGFANAVTQSLDDPAWDERLGHWEEAWHWATADNWLEKRADIGYQQELWERRDTIEQKIGKLLAEAASLRAWKHFFARLSIRESNALKAWRETVKAMGKGTGRSAKMARLRREAREYMDECRDAIPIWIMPRYLVAEMVDPKPGRYDHIIVDEASQLGVESLFLFYIGSKMVVVGDDQQISPMGVGIKDEEVAGLQQQFLQDVRYKGILSAQSSLYSNAKVRYQHQIVLREHFRCMPEIIQFSNDLCYASQGTPLDPLRAYPANRKQPLVLRHVPDGYRTGSTQHARNEPEAEALVAQIVACIEDPRYEGATMGVTSLQGEAQANHIANLLLSHLDSEVIEERRLICGDAYAFQGDERDIMFLSMVAAPGKTRIGTLSADSARQRFNVAASRARDQLWLFHTATLDDLSPKCMRHRLLNYFMDPTRQATDEEEQTFDSEFERAVYRMIAARNFHVRTQVCVGDPTNHRYRIDLVVEGIQGRLAVECDGDHWHGPDRYEQDMARQRDLERAGWQFVRIRGGDFYRDPERAMQPLWDELERLGIHPGGLDEAAAEPPPPGSLEPSDGEPDSELASEDNLEGEEEDVDEVSEIEQEESAEDKDAISPVESSVEPASTPPRSLEDLAASAALLGRAQKQMTLPETTDRAYLLVQQNENAGRPSDRETPLPESDGPEASATQFGNGGTPEAPAQYLEHTGPTGPDPRTVGPAEVARGLCKIIEWEGPMLARRAYTVYLKGCGIQRMGKELKRTMNKALQHAIRTGRVEREDEMGTGGLVNSIVRLTGTLPLNVRTLGHRTLEEIPPSEIQAVARYLEAQEGYQTGSEAHLRAILEYYGLVRLTTKSNKTMLAALKRGYSYVNTLFESDT